MSRRTRIGLGIWAALTGLAIAAGGQTAIDSWRTDCNANGIPDECDLACGEPGGPCDLPGCGQSADCNTNGVPDECELVPAALPQLSGLTLWLRADSITGVPDGQPVALWLDQSGNGLDVSQGTPSWQPVFLSAALNGLPALRFQSDFLIRTNVLGSALTSAQYATAFFVIRPLMTGSSGTVMKWGPTFDNEFHLARNQGGVLSFQHGNLEGGRLTWWTPDGWTDAFHYVQFVRDGPVGQVWVEGTLLDLNPPGDTFTDALDPADYAQLRVGDSFSGDIAELLVYNRALPSADREAVQAYLVAKYFGSGIVNDCNANGIPDDCDISGGSSADCNLTGVPDECEIACGASQDCNANSVPDECELVGGDCNANGIPDECDISAGTSQDCNGNSVPDECEPLDDCNENGVQDICDIGGGTSEDCNGNWVPDECDIVPVFDGFADSVEYPVWSGGPIGIVASRIEPNAQRAGLDLDGDGDTDLACVTFVNGASLYIFLNSAHGDFELQPSYSVTGKATGVVAGDLDGDGNGDLAVATQANSISILLGNGDGTFAPETRYALAGYTWKLTLGDLDGDGDIDIAAARGGSSGKAIILLNQGNGTFSAAVEYAAGAGARALTAADLDGDNDLDLAVTLDQSEYRVAILKNNGNGTFAAPLTYTVGIGPWDIVAGDWDGDGDRDLAVACTGSGVAVLYNSGSGAFGSPTYLAGDYGGPQAVTCVDFEGDGDLDLVSANQSSNNVSVFLNNGAGSFGTAINFETGLGPRGLDAGDLDGDTFPDLAIANGSSYDISVLLNEPNDPDCNDNGTLDECDIVAGFSTDCNVNGVPDECEAQSDCNHNGVPDICDLANGTSTDCNANAVPDECDIAAGTSQDCNLNTIPDECDLAGGMSADCNGNNTPDECDIANGTSQDCNTNNVPDDCDIVVGTSEDCDDSGVPDECEALPDCNGNAQADACDIIVRGLTFAIASSCNVHEPAYQAVPADLDGDQDPDLAVARRPGDQIALLRNNGSGTFVKYADVDVDDIPEAIAAADLDRDGDQDLVVATTPSTYLSLLRNNGSGTFAPFERVGCGCPPTGLVAARLDADEDIDLAVICAETGSCWVMLNDGYGGFDDATHYGIDAAPFGVIAADLDSDGDNDLAVAGNGGPGVWILLNNGDGSFVMGESYGGGAFVPYLDFGDVDGDGDLDLVYADLMGDSVAVLFNNGNATFGATAYYDAGGDHPTCVRVGELNGDALPDLIVANNNSDNVAVLLGFGDGTFAPPVSEALLGAYQVAVEDLDGDGDRDLVVARAIYEGQVTTLLNESLTPLLPTSRDCNRNAVPDECESQADCNQNGWLDLCDLATGVSLDCNANAVPDECDIAGGFSADCNVNGVPDDCEAQSDCNANGLLDICDLYNGTATDCNANGVLDECDIAAGTSQDCNLNAVPDECDLASGTSADCNGNNTPDECDIANGASQDCNANGAPDECDIANGTSTDVNGDGIPDDCQTDVRVLAVPVTINPTSTTDHRNVQPTGVAGVTRGATFWVEVWASDVGTTNTGLTGVYVDLVFCDVVTPLAISHGNIFTTFPSGTLLPHGVDEFGGSALPHGGGVAPQWVRVGWITMRADLETEMCSLDLAPSSTGVAAHQRGLVPWAFVSLESADLTIFTPTVNYDLDGDSFIGVGDLSIFAGSWLQAVPPANTDHDFDCDDYVGVGDLSWFATAWLRYITDPAIQYSPDCSGQFRFAGDGDGRRGRTADIEFRLVALATPSTTDLTTTLPSSLSSVSVGQDYYVEVWVSDLGDINTGLTSAYIDLSYPSPAASVVQITHTALFSLFPSGQDVGGMLDELGGSNLPGGVGIAPQWARVAVIQVHADGATTGATYGAAPSDTGVAALARGVIPWPDIALGQVTLAHQGGGLVGDLNCDGTVGFGDINPFVLYLSNFASWQATYPNCPPLNGDINGDGSYPSFADINPFVSLLTGGGG